jgi:hypothetical protein
VICTSSGVMQISPTTDDGDTPAVAFMLDCPLCMPVAAPPPVARQLVEPHYALSYALRPVPAAHVALRTASPLPARGPPVFS